MEITAGDLKIIELLAIDIHFGYQIESGRDAPLWAIVARGKAAQAAAERNEEDGRPTIRTSA